MTLLDRYVLRIVLGALGATLLFFLFMAVLVDLLKNVTDYAENAAKAGQGGMDLAITLFFHYVKLVPILFTTFTPLATAIACMFAVARLQHANEVVPMLFVGRSIRRVLRPMLLVGLLAGLSMAACWQWVVPVAGAGLVTDQPLLKPKAATQKLLIYEPHTEPRCYLRIQEYDPVARVAKGLVLLTQGVLAADVSLVEAEGAEWDRERRDWRLTGGWLTRARMKETQDWLLRPDMTPEVVLRAGRDTIDPDQLSYTDLLDLQITRPNKREVQYSLHRHLTYPLANLLLLLLVLPMAVHYERGSRIGRVLLAILLCGGYVLLDLCCQSLGQTFVHPIVAAWVPTIVFGSLGVVLFGGMRT